MLNCLNVTGLIDLPLSKPKRSGAVLDENQFMIRKLLPLTLSILISINWVFAQNLTIGSTGDYQNLSNAESVLSPGDTAFILNETFSNGTQFLDGVNGAAGQPVVIMAQTQHQPVFSGGSEAIHLINCSYVEINGLVIEGQTANGINIDDGGDYATPATNITVRNCIFQDITTSGNHDFLKMSGVDDFLVENCSFTSGTGGSGVDMVGCHEGVIQNCTFDAAGISGIQCKGGTQDILIRRNVIKNHSQRGINLGGNTGLQYFRPSLPDPIVNATEASDLEVHSNVFIGNWAPLAYVGSMNVNVVNNTFYQPDNWVFRILQENTTTGFLPCSNNSFSNNIVYLQSDITEVNTGGNTLPNTFEVSNNLWFNQSSSNWSPSLPVSDPNQQIADPLFSNAQAEDFSLQALSPAIGHGSSALAPTSDFNDQPFLTPPSAGAFEGGQSTVSISHSERNQPSFSIYPNPAIHTTTIESKEMFRHLQVVDFQGRTVLDQTIESKSRHELDVSNLMAGTYIVNVFGEFGFLSKPLIIAHDQATE